MDSPPLHTTCFPRLANSTPPPTTTNPQSLLNPQSLFKLRDFVMRKETYTGVQAEILAPG